MDLVNPRGPVVLRFKELTVLCICPDMFSLTYLNLEALTFKLLIRLDAKKGEENGVSTLCWKHSPTHVNSAVHLTFPDVAG